MLFSLIHDQFTGVPYALGHLVTFGEGPAVPGRVESTIAINKS